MGAMTVKKRKPALSLIIQDKIRTEYGEGAKCSELARKYKRGTSIIHRYINDVSRDGEQLAHKIAEVQREIKGHTGHEQTLILKRSDEIEKVKSLVLNGTKYIAGRTLNKLRHTQDDKINFNDLSQAQGVMTKASALVEPKIANQVNVNTQVNNGQMTKQEVKAELLTDDIPLDVLDELGFLDD